jgi:hypothetical protein
VPIKVGLLLDSYAVPAWQQEILQFVCRDRCFSIELVILNRGDNKPRASRIIYRLFRSMERRLFAVNNNLFFRSSVAALLNDVSVLEAKPVQTKFKDEFSADDLQIIRQKNLDVVLRFGFRVLKGEILSAAKYGVWSLHHGDNDVNRGGPPAFWEVVNREPVTGITLQILSDVLDGGMVIGKSFVKTDMTSFNRNQNAVYWAGVELFCDKLKKLAHSPQSFLEKALCPATFTRYDRPLFRDPGSFRSAEIGIKFLFQRLLSVIKKLFNTQQWIILYQFSKNSSAQPLYKFVKLTPPAKTDWADPFVIFRDNQYYVFFEELIRSRGKGHISYFAFDQKGNPVTKNPVKVLEESFHLSYPFIFSYNDDLLMIPESAAGKSVCLYKCEHFPDQWERHSVLINEPLYDPTLFRHEGLWYLFGTRKPFRGNSPDQYLHIYFTEDLLSGQWREHASNPVTRDVRGARPAGKIFKENGKIIRPSQIGTPKYGYGIAFKEVTALSPTEFKEETIDTILPLWEKRILATHTFNYDNGLTVIDAQYNANS